jgi:GLPGLI family protein
MKSLVYTFLLLLCGGLVNAQSSATVTYQWNDAFGYQPQFTLHIDGPISVFRHHQPYQELAFDEGFEVTIDKNHFDFWYNNQEQQLLEIREMPNGVNTIAGWNPAEMEWEITDETKTYRGYTVQKAVTKAHLTCEQAYGFGDAIAWFAVDLPFPTGPMRYYGLPGLILELTFTERGQTCRMVDIDFESTEELCWPADPSGLTISKAATLYPALISQRDLRNYKKGLNGK